MMGANVQSEKNIALLMASVIMKESPSRMRDCQSHETAYFIAKRVACASPTLTLREGNLLVTAEIIWPLESLMIAAATAKLC